MLGFRHVGTDRQKYHGFKPITENGWTIENTKLCVVWDTEENMQLVRERVDLLLRRCKCVTGCKNRVYGCKRKNSKCTEGCQCINCENEVSPAVQSDKLSVIALEEEVRSSGICMKMKKMSLLSLFAATCATDSEPNISMDHQDD